MVDESRPSLVVIDLYRFADAVRRRVDTSVLLSDSAIRNRLGRLLKPRRLYCSLIPRSEERGPIEAQNSEGEVGVLSGIRRQLLTSR